MEEKKYIKLQDLEVYQISRELSKLGWKVYKDLSFEHKKTMGDQFIRSIDSVGANIAEGYSRFHYLDKNRFYYNSRASLSEAIDHWLELLFERGLIDSKIFNEFKLKGKVLQVKLNNFITMTFIQKTSK
ncbi:MAG TPA: four helix bundle protein [Saprospiraceae bacterium]|nr:four helix bundle protein [Saprospiraceae bacterium]